MDWIPVIDITDHTAMAMHVGWAAFAISLLSYQAKTGAGILYIQIFSTALWLFHYVFLGYGAPAAVCVLAIIRNIFGLKLSPRYRKPFLMVIMTLAWVMTMVLYQIPADLLGAIATTAVTASIFFKDNPLAVRSALLFSESCWWLNSYVIGSVPGIAMCTLSIASNIVGAIRHRQRFLGLHAAFKIKRGKI